MRAFLFLLPLLAAHAVAQPCDPVCDPKCDPKAKAKATATVVSCDPFQGAQTVRLSRPSTRAVAGTPAPAVAVAPCDVTVSCDPICAPALAPTSVAGGVAVCAPSGSGLVAVGQGSGCSAAKVSAQGSCSSSTTTTPSVVTVTHDPAGAQAGNVYATRAARTRDAAQSRGRLARTAEELDLDDETRESIREAIEEAREAQREAMEDAREAQREAVEAQHEAAEAQREAMQEAREAMRDAEADVQEQLRAFQSSNGEMFQDGQLEALTREALETAQKAMAEIDFEQLQGMPFTAFAAPAEAQGRRSGGDGLEDRVRALERIARQQGHETTTDGSLEDRVEALERALGASRRSAEKMTAERALQLYGLKGKQGQDGKTARSPKAPKPPKAGKPGKGGVRAYSLDEHGKLHELDVPTAPLPAMPPEPPDAPAPPSNPTPPGVWKSRTPPPAGSGTWMRTAPNAEERRDIEEQMMKLREEAEALRTEVQRMREKLESLPKHDEHGAR